MRYVFIQNCTVEIVGFFLIFFTPSLAYSLPQKLFLPSTLATACKADMMRQPTATQKSILRFSSSLIGSCQSEFLAFLRVEPMLNCKRD